MNGAFQRTRRLIGEAAMEKLARSRVAVFGLGLHQYGIGVTENHEILVADVPGLGG